LAKAVLNGVVIAESAETPVVDGYRYFPVDTVHMEYLMPSAHTSVCPWKGVASYFDIKVDDQCGGERRLVLPDPQEGGGPHQRTDRVLGRGERRNVRAEGGQTDLPSLAHFLLSQ